MKDPETQAAEEDCSPVNTFWTKKWVLDQKLRTGEQTTVEARSIILFDKSACLYLH